MYLSQELFIVTGQQVRSADAETKTRFKITIEGAIDTYTYTTMPVAGYRVITTFRLIRNKLNTIFILFLFYFF